MSLVLNRYQLADVVYEDDRVIAYHGYDETLKRPVVVETGAPQSQDSQIAQQLLEKAHQAARINLPHVAALYNQHTDRGQTYLVWEAVAGRPVSKIAPLQPEDAAAVIGAVAETAQAALSRRLPLPPLLAENVYLGSRGQVQITNLGLHTGASTNPQATVALGYLLQQMLGDAAAPTPLQNLANQAMAGQIPTVDGFVANLRRIRQHVDVPTVVMPRAQAPEPPRQPTAQDTARAAATVPAAHYAAHNAHTMPMNAHANRMGAQRRTRSTLPVRPEPPARPSSTGWIWALLAFAVLALLAFVFIPRLFSGLLSGTPAAEPTSPAIAEGDASPSPDDAPVNGVDQASPSPEASPTPETTPEPSPSPAGNVYVVATTTGQNLVVRSGPGIGAQQIGTLVNGTPVEVLSAPQALDGYNWVQIRAGEIEGWSIIEALSRDEAAAPPDASPPASPQPTPAASPTPASSPTTPAGQPVPDGPGQNYVVATINGQPLVVRSGPGTSASRIGSLPNGTIVQVVGSPQSSGDREWVPVRGGGLEGWVAFGGLRQQ